MSASATPLAFLVSFTDGRPGARVPITGPDFYIGRDLSNQLPLIDDPAVSRQHCVIHVVGTSLMLEDLKSRNGTHLNGQPVTGGVLLPVPSELIVGHTRIAIQPARAPIADVTSVIDTRQAADDSIVLPSSGFFRVQGEPEAFLVCDLVDSTRLLEQNDVLFAKVVLAMGRMLERAIAGEPRPTLKFTGDGYFACFSTAAAALEAGLRLAPGLNRALDADVQVSVALHWGTAQVTEDGEDRSGRHVHAVFSLEQVRHQDATLEEELRSRVPRTLVLMTEAFWEQLDEPTRAQARPLGFFRLKGLEEGTQILRWSGASG